MSIIEIVEEIEKELNSESFSYAKFRDFIHDLLAEQLNRVNEFINDGLIIKE